MVTFKVRKWSPKANRVFEESNPQRRVEVLGEVVGGCSPS